MIRAEQEAFTRSAMQLVDLRSSLAAQLTAAEWESVQAAWDETP